MTRSTGRLKVVRQQLDHTDRRIVAALLADPRASWRTIAATLDLSERTVIRRAGPLLADGTVRVTATPNPICFPDLIPIALRIRCRPQNIRTVAAGLARRPGTMWLDILSSGNELLAVLFLEDAAARNKLLLRDLPATEAVTSWTSHAVLRVFQEAFDWSAGLLTPDERDALRPEQPDVPAGAIPLDDTDHALIQALTANGRATYADLAEHAGITPLSARKRANRLIGNAIVPSADVDVAVLGITTEALLWITVAPHSMDRTAYALAVHPQVRLVVATTGPTNLLAGVATTDLDALYRLLTESLDGLENVRSVEVTPILMTYKRNRLPRPM